MSHSVLCSIQVFRHYVTIEVMSHSGVMSFGIMSHSVFCCILTYVMRDCVVPHNVVLVNVIRHNVIRPTVGVLNGDCSKKLKFQSPAK